MNRFRQQFDSFLPTFRRELGAYFATPMAYVFLAVFLLSIGMFTWEAARFFDTGTADLSPFFVWHPWIYMIFLPALAMRLWADETSAGTDELLLSLPLGMPGLVLGKLCAAARSSFPDMFNDPKRCAARPVRADVGQPVLDVGV